jgi:hypothetical protein
LEDFFTDAGLAFPADHAARREAARRQRRIQKTPQPLRPAVARYAAALTTAQQRAPRAGTRPRADRTLADDLAVLRDLALFLAGGQAKTDGATVQAADLEAFLAVRPAGRTRRLTTLRSFFRGQARIEPGTEPGQSGQRLDAGGIVHHTHLYGLRVIG